MAVKIQQRFRSKTPFETFGTDWTKLFMHNWPDELKDAYIQFDIDNNYYQRPDEETLFLHVSMGIAQGTVIPVSDPTSGRTKFIGEAVNKASKLEEYGFGGEILLDGDMKKLIEDAT
eukprot:81216_1